MVFMVDGSGAHAREVAEKDRGQGRIVRAIREVKGGWGAGTQKRGARTHGRA
jgi:hypothetical protein